MASKRRRRRSRCAPTCTSATARNKGDARFHHAFHEDIISMYKTGKVKHAFAAWHEGKVLPGCSNY